MAIDTNGNLYAAYSGDAIVEFTTNGGSLFVTNIGAPNNLAFDNIGNLYGNSNDCVIAITTNGATIYASGITGLNAFCFDNAGNLYASTASQILRITPGGISNVFATVSSITGPLDPFHDYESIYSVASDAQSSIYAAVTEEGAGTQYYAFMLDCMTA